MVVFMIPHQKFVFRGKCPSCKNVIEYNSVQFSLDNDRGEMIAECSKCEKKLKVPTINPMESYITLGASKEDYVDYEISKPTSHAHLVEIIQFESNLNVPKPEYNLTTTPIYSCSSCGDRLDELAFIKLKGSFLAVIKEENNYTSLVIKGYANFADKFIISNTITCSCQKEYDTYFFKKYDHSGYELADFKLGAITGGDALDNDIDGTKSKTECMEILKKCLIRWDFLFDSVYVITPFFGYQHLPEEKLLDTWFSIINQLNPDRSKIITRTATLNIFKKAFSNQIHDYSFLNEYALGVPSVDNASKLQASHAKIYCGVSSDYCEVVQGSANIAYGPSSEQISFHQFDSYNKLYSKYLQHLNVKDIPKSLDINSNVSVLFTEKNGFKAETLKNNELITMVK